MKKNTFTCVSALIITAGATLAAQTMRINGAGATFRPPIGTQLTNPIDDRARW